MTNNESTINQAELVQQLTNLVSEYQHQQQVQYDRSLTRIRELENQVAELQSQLSTKKGFLDDLYDKGLRKRMEPLEAASFDTLIREAGVTLETRLRSMVGIEGEGKTGSSLVDVAFNPSTGMFQVSSIKAEQLGIHSLFRGAIMFLRNPPMHRLIDYPESTARMTLRLIDSLLLLLAEIDPPKGGERWSGEKPAREIVWEAVQSLTRKRPERIFAPKDVVNAIHSKHPNFNAATARALLTSDTVNHSSRHHYPGGKDRYWLVSKGKYRLYDPQLDHLLD